MTNYYINQLTLTYRAVKLTFSNFFIETPRVHLSRFELVYYIHFLNDFSKKHLFVVIAKRRHQE